MLPPGTTTKLVNNRVKEKIGRFVHLAKDAEQIKIEIEEKKLKSEKQIRAIKFVLENGEMLVQDLEKITEVSRAILKTLEKNQYIRMYEKVLQRDPFINKKINKTSNLVFNEEQQKAYNAISDSIDDYMNSEFLIYGVTGSR